MKNLLNKLGYKVAIGVEKQGKNYLHATTAYNSEGLEVILRVGQENFKASILALSTREINYRVVGIFAVIKSKERGKTCV